MRGVGGAQHPPLLLHDPPPQPAPSRLGRPAIERVELFVAVVGHRPREAGRSAAAVAPVADVERWARTGSLLPELRTAIHGAVLRSLG